VTITDFIRQMPKVELHVHLEGAVRPETLLKLARRHGVALPADTVEGLRDWYRFIDFPHFVEVYIKLSKCIRTAEDIELIAREFLEGQAAQNIRYSEVTYTAYTHYLQKGIDFADQLAALNRARAWGESELGVRMNLIIDIPREIPADKGPLTAEWAISGWGDGVVALGLGGYEVGNPPEKFADSFKLAEQAGLPSVPHAGETLGPESIWGALRTLNPVRIGHGVRCVEDPALVEELRERQIPLEICPTSNLCLGVAPDLASHPLPKLIDAGLYVTINSDDPPLFNTTLTEEYLKIADAYGYDESMIEKLVMNAVRVTLLDEADKAAMIKEFEAEFARLRAT
jgi:aminodeoxyfutalosine deaminase